MRKEAVKGRGCHEPGFGRADAHHIRSSAERIALDLDANYLRECTVYPFHNGNLGVIEIPSCACHLKPQWGRNEKQQVLLAYSSFPLSAILPSIL